MEIPLPRKYKVARRTRYKGGERPAPKKHRDKVGKAAHEARYGAPPVVVRVVDGRTGKSKMVKVDAAG